MSIVLKNVPDDLRAQLEQEAAANFRTLDEEALARLQRSFDLELNTERDQRWIDEALASGPATPLTRGEFDAAYERAMKRFKANPTAK
jgi:plasmid stability protein